MTVPIVVPSHRRAGHVTTHKFIWPLTLCVPEAQAKDYEEAHPGVELLVHPDSILGSAPKRQWMFDQVGDIMMLDDDMADMYSMVDGPGEGVRRFDKEEAFDLVQGVADTARELGVYLFSFATSADPRNYIPQMPFRMIGAVNGNMGLFKDGPKGPSKLYFPDDPQCAVEDYFIAGLNAFHYRYLFVDNRFCMRDGSKAFATPGGVAEWRTTDNLEHWYHELKRYFGEAIQHKQKPESVRGKMSHEWECNLYIPW